MVAIHKTEHQQEAGHVTSPEGGRLLVLGQEERPVGRGGVLEPLLLG